MPDIELARRMPIIGRLSTHATSSTTSATGRTLYFHPRSNGGPNDGSTSEGMVIWVASRGEWSRGYIATNKISVTIAVGDSTTYPADLPHDVFHVFDPVNGHALLLRAWDSQTSRNRANFTYIRGRYCMRHPTTNVPIPYLGTVVPFLENGQVQFVSRPGNRLVWNAYDQRLRVDSFIDGTPDWLVNQTGGADVFAPIASIRSFDRLWQCRFIIGLPIRTNYNVGENGPVAPNVLTYSNNSPAFEVRVWGDRSAVVALGMDSTTATNNSGSPISNNDTNGPGAADQGAYLISYRMGDPNRFVAYREINVLANNGNGTRKFYTRRPVVIIEPLLGFDGNPIIPRGPVHRVEDIISNLGAGLVGRQPNAQEAERIRQDNASIFRTYIDG